MPGNSLHHELGTGPVSQAFNSLGIAYLDSAAEYVRKLPYARTSDSQNVLLVLSEGCGTCSSKHALLKLAADEANFSELALMLGFYEMSGATNPGVEVVLSRNRLQCLPEAHCYLMLGEQRLDFTGLPAGIAGPFDRLIVEERISVTEVLAEKKSRHRRFVTLWSHERALNSKVVWAAREQCVALLVAQARP